MAIGSTGLFRAAIVSGCSLLALTCPAGVAFAQESGAVSGVGDIVVTARRKDERLMDVPVVVSTISGETLERYKSDSLTAIGEMSPSVIVGLYKGQGGGTIAIRGISSPANQTGFEQAASVAIDGVQTSNGRIAQLGFFDLEQVEVLKGPQALFFGKNSPAGVISVRTAGPSSEFTAGIRASYEFVADEASIDGFVAGPLSDTVGARLAFKYRNMDGWLRNTAVPVANPFYNPATGAPASVGQLPGTSDTRPGDEEIMGRLTLKIDPSDSFKATARVFYDHLTDQGPGVATQNIGPCSGGPYPRVYGIQDTAADCKADRYATVGDVPAAIAETYNGLDVDGGGQGKMDALISSLSMEWAFGNLSLASLTGYNWLRYNAFSGLDQTNYSQLAQVEKVSTKEFSQELRLSSDFDSPFNFVLGGYYQRTTLATYHDTKLTDGGYDAVANRYSAFETRSDQTGHTYSVFGQALWDISEQLELAGGARWTREDKSFDKFNLYGNPNVSGGAFANYTTIYPGSDTPGHLQGKFKDENVSPEVTLTWKPDSLHTVFAAYRTGFKSGGFGLTNPITKGTRIGDSDFGSEKAKGFEVGARGIFLDGRLNLSAAAFAYDFKDLQVNVYDSSRIAFTINNAGKVRQRGFELESNFRAADFLTLHGAVSYVRNRFKDFIGQCYSYRFPTGQNPQTGAVPPPNCSFVDPTSTSTTLQQVYDGRAPARSPTWSGNAGFVATAPIGDEMELRFTGDAFYSDGYYAADTLVEASFQKSFWRMNSSLTLAQADDHWSIGLIGRNLTNKHYLLYAADRTGGSSVSGAIGEQRGVVSRGREVSVQASFKF